MALKCKTQKHLNIFNFLKSLQMTTGGTSSPNKQNIAKIDPCI